MSLPDEEESPEAKAALAAWHVEHREVGYGGAWRAAGDSLLSPAWSSLRSVAVDPGSGNVVAAGRLASAAWGIDNNAPAFLQIDGLYVGSLRSGSLLPLDLGISASSVDLNPVTGEIAVFHHLASSTFAVSIIDRHGVRRLLTVIEELAGNEPIHFSPDGRWLLVPHSMGVSHIVEVSTGRWLLLNVGNCAWAPATASGLITIAHHDGKAFPRLFDLETNSFVQDFPAVELDVPLLESYPHLWWPAVSPDGSEVLAQTPAGATVEYQSTYGVGSHLARFDLQSGRGRLITSPFANDAQTLERDVIDARWTEPADPSWTLSLHPELSKELHEPVTQAQDPTWLRRERWADEAEIVLVSVMNRAITLAQEESSVAHLMPEIVAALSVIANSPVWPRQAEWLTNLRDITMSMVSSGEMDGDLSLPWMLFAIAIRAIEQGDSSEISALVVRR
ncbi:MAG TPA: hypothetical protein VN108_10795 [Marmoricola sp.]|nr:hypothetical protein [Marmoricola sp.]